MEERTSTNKELKPLTAHDSGPWAPTKKIFGPKESSECDLADGKPPRPLGLHLGVIISGQKVKVNKKYKKVTKSVKIDAPGFKISSYAWKIQNRTRGIDLEGSRSRRKPKKGSYKGSKVTKNDQKVKTPNQNRLITQHTSHLWT